MLKIADKSKNRQNSKKIFIFDVDSRTAVSERFGEIAFAAMVKKSIKEGFIDDPGNLAFGGASNPFSTLAMQSILQQLKVQKKVLCLIFDQFEELLYKEDLAQCFEEIRVLCDAVDASKENVVMSALPPKADILGL